MPRLLLILVAALGGAAIWRRREIRNDADRASKALAGAAASATSRIRPGDVAEQGDGEMAAAEAEANADADDSAERTTSAD